jgi:hypothetical protein
LHLSQARRDRPTQRRNFLPLAPEIVLDVERADTLGDAGFTAGRTVAPPHDGRMADTASIRAVTIRTVQREIIARALQGLSQAESHLERHHWFT